MSRAPTVFESGVENIPLFVQGEDGVAITTLDHTSAITIKYRRQDQASWTTITKVTGTIGTATSSGFKHDEDGVYQLGLPATAKEGGYWVLVKWSGTGILTDQMLLPIHRLNHQDDVRAGLSALPNAAHDTPGGLPISDAGGLDMDAMAADVAGLDGAAMRGTDGANTKVPDNTQGATVIAVLGDVLGAPIDTNLATDISHIQLAVENLNFATPTNVTDAQTAIISQVDANEAKIDAGNAVLAKLNSGLESDGSGGYQGTALFLENGPSGGGDATEANQLQILSDISDVQTAVDAIDVGAGSGPSVVTISVVDQDANDLEGVSVRLTDFATRNYVSTTGVSGAINPLIGAEDATYTLVLSKDGYGNSVTTLVVSGDTSPVAYVLTATVITPASNPAKSTLTVTCYDEFGNIEPGAIVSIQFAVIPSGDNARSYDKKPAEAIADGSGVAAFDGGDGSGGVVRLARYHVWRGSGPKSLISIPDAATCTVTSFLGREIE